MISLDQDFDTAFANKIARLESYNKHLYRPNTYLHKWWARRCGSTFRLILKQLTPDEAHRGYYAGGGLEGVVICDPMMGGGTVIHEAIRMSANVIGVDIDPIPVLQARASLSKLGVGDIEGPFFEILARLEQELGPLFLSSCPVCEAPVPLRYTLYGYRRHCLCGPTLHVDSLILRHEGDQQTRSLCDHCHQVHVGEYCPDHQLPPRTPPLYEKRVQSCPKCRESFTDDLDRPYYERYQPLVVVGKCVEHGLFFKGVEQGDTALVDQADSQRDGLAFSVDLSISPGPKSNSLLRRKIAAYDELFSSRQLLFLHVVIGHLKQIDPAIRLYLALLFSTAMEFNSMLCGYKGTQKRRAGAIRHAFSHHGYSFPYTALENNPIYPGQSSGTLRKLYHDRVVRAKTWAKRPKERNVQGGDKKYLFINGEVDAGTEVTEPAGLQHGTRRFFLSQGSATSLNVADGSVDFIVTDPPYYDSIEYSDLSAFFRVWLRQFVGPNMLPEIRWNYDKRYFGEQQSELEPQEQTYHDFLQMMSGIFAECTRVLRKDHGRLVFTFHHWQPDAWAALSAGLQRAGFILINRYVVHSENPVSVHIANMKALTDDVILVLAPTANHLQGWRNPGRLNSTSSADFCADCGTLLGWLLEREFTEEEIRQTWHRAIGGT
jgi:hypothetical protein